MHQLHHIVFGRQSTSVCLIGLKYALQLSLNSCSSFHKAIPKIAFSKVGATAHPAPLVLTPIYYVYVLGECIALWGEPNERSIQDHILQYVDN